MIKHLIKRIIVIGGNAAGAAAAAKAKRVNPNAEVLLIEKGKFISIGTCELPYTLTGEVKNVESLIFFDEKSFENEKGVKVLTSTEVTGICTKRKEVKLKQSENENKLPLNYDTLVIATGSKVRELPELQGEFQNLFKLKTVSDAYKLKDWLLVNKEKTVVIFGSGYTGLEVAESFTKLGFRTILIEKMNIPFPGAEPEISAVISEVLNLHGIEFYSSNYSQLKVYSDNNLITKFKIDGRLVDTSLVINATGFIPYIPDEIAKKFELTNQGVFKTCKKMQTSTPGIYAAGDCAGYKNFQTGNMDFFPLATLAQRSGHIAGENAAGGNAYIEPFVKNISLRFFEHFITQTGLTLLQAKNYFPGAVSVFSGGLNLVKVMPGSRNIFGKLVFDKNSKMVLGASFIGSSEVSGYADLISLAIRNKLRITDLKAIDFNYTPSLSPFINLISLLIRKAESI